MHRQILTLLTDFGTSDSYVAQMKGVLLSRCPDCTLVDISHQIPPQDVRKASQIIAEVVPQFPAGTVHLVVVDPGVGTQRSILAIEVAEQSLVLPDNGLLTRLLENFASSRIHRVENRGLWKSPVSPTFHGRDIIAPVAAFIASGGPWEEIGPAVGQVVRLEQRSVAKKESSTTWSCEISSQDGFGNVVLGSSEELLDCLPVGATIHLQFGENQHFHVPVVETYGQARPGELVLLRDSQNRLELAQVNGSAARKLNLQPHGSVKISLESGQ